MTRFLPLALAAVLAPAAAGVADDAPGPPAEGPPLALNLAGVVDWSTELPFIDLFKRARMWIPQAEGKPWGRGEPLELAPEGWVARLAPGQYATTVLSGGGHPAGTYTCLYDGDGELRFWGAAEVVGGGDGRLDVAVEADGSIFLDLRRTDPSDPVRNVRLLLPGLDESGPTGPFHPHFLERTGRFRAIRFMDWMATNGSEVAEWADRPTPSDFSQAIKGVSLEHMIDLCNRLRVDPWFCMPHLASDDFVRRFASMVRDRLDPGLTIYVEHSNEVWNGQFAQARHARERGKALGLSDNDYQAQLFYHSTRSVAIFAIWEEVFGGADRLVRVLGSQSANPWVSEQVATFRDAHRHADALAIAPYFGNALGSPETADRVARMSVDEVIAACRGAIAANRETIAAQKAIADRLGLDLIAYEGGQHLAGYGGAENNEALTALLIAANRDPRMADLYREDLRQWREVAGGLFAVFSSVSSPSKWGSWGLLESEFQDPAEAPKYRAVRELLGPAPAADAR